MSSNERPPLSKLTTRCDDRRTVAKCFLLKSGIVLEVPLFCKCPEILIIGLKKTST